MLPPYVRALLGSRPKDPGFWSTTVSYGDWTIAGNLVTKNDSGATYLRYEKGLVKKSYFEVYGTGFSTAFLAGVVSGSWAAGDVPGTSSNGWGIISNNGYKYHNGSQADIGLSAVGAPGALRVAVDPPAGKIWFGHGGGMSGDPAEGTGEAFSNVSAEVFPAIYLGTYNSTALIRTKISEMVYPVPFGFYGPDD